MSEEIIKVLDNLAERFGIAIDWTSQNVMPYLQELFTRYQHYTVTLSAIYLVLEIIVLVVMAMCIISGIREKKKSKNSYWEWIDEGCGRFWFSVVAGVILLVSVPMTVDMLLKGIYLPELLILNELKGI